MIEEGNALTIGCNVISVSENEVSPIEAIQATARNLAIVREFTSPVENLADGMLLSGTNAWGAFCAVRGDSNFEKGKGEPSRASDIDLLITSQSIDRLGDILQRYISLGLVDESESKRFLVFKDLYTSKKADMFSVRSNYGGVEESLHFIPMDVIDTICNLEPVADSSKSGFDLDFLNDFRTTIPGNVRKYGGYPTGDLKGLRVESFVPIPQEIKYPGTNEVAGYITQNPVGGPKVVDGQQTYFMGVIPFFLTISPKLLIDKDNLLSRRITMLRSNIRTIMNDQEIQYIPRQERMPRRTRELVLQSFHN